MAVSAAPSREAIEKVVNAYYASICALDEDGFVNTFAADAEYHDPVGAPPHIGQAAAREFFSGMASLVESATITPEATYVGGTSAAVPWRLTARGKNGKTASSQGVDVFIVNAEGRIQTAYGYWDAEAFVAALS